MWQRGVRVLKSVPSQYMLGKPSYPRQVRSPSLRSGLRMGRMARFELARFGIAGALTRCATDVRAYPPGPRTGFEPVTSRPAGALPLSYIRVRMFYPTASYGAGCR